MKPIERSVAVAMFGKSYEVDYGALLPHFSYSDFLTARDLDGIAARWINRPSESKVIQVYECLGSRRTSVYEGWNKFFHDKFNAMGNVTASPLTQAVIEHTAGAYEQARKSKSGSSYRKPSLFARLLSDNWKVLPSETNRLFSDLRVDIVPLPEELFLSDYFLAPGDKVFHLITGNILEGTKIVEYTIRDRQLSTYSWSCYCVKYTALNERSTMPLHFDLQNGAISMPTYGDCTSPRSAGPLFVSREEAERAEAAIWEVAELRLKQYARAKEPQ